MEKVFKYMLGDSPLNALEGVVYELRKDELSFEGPQPNWEYTIETGIAGMKNLNDAIKESQIKAGLIINATELRLQTGIDKDGIAFTTYTIPFLSKVKLKLNPEFDLENSDTQYIYGFASTSYNYLIKENDTEVATLIAEGFRSWKISATVECIVQAMSEYAAFGKLEELIGKDASIDKLTRKAEMLPKFDREEFEIEVQKLAKQSGLTIDLNIHE